MYAGVSAPLIGVTPMCMFFSITIQLVQSILTLLWTVAVSFWGYDVGKNLVRRFSVVENNQLSTAQISFAGFFSAIPMTLITAPFERVKVLLQIQGQTAEKKYSSSLDVVRQLYKEGGIRSVFRGSTATLARDGPGSAAYFATYEILKKRLTPEGEQMSMPAVMAAGGAAGMAMWLLVFPVDTVKSRLQSAEGRPTIGGVVREIYGRGGYKAFFPGLGPALLRSVPANSMCFLGVELAHKLMNKTFGA
jgi:solute carrier family 25 (mitochondrial carnitine/acylcarnitine transporter), member 20/29